MHEISISFLEKIGKLGVNSVNKRIDVRLSSFGPRWVPQVIRRDEFSNRAEKAVHNFPDVIVRFGIASDDKLSFPNFPSATDNY